jgi:hypothetical protein
VFGGKEDLMKIDSRICGKIRNCFLKKKLGIISLHDSFVVDADHEQLLIDTMISAFKETLKCDFAPPLKIIELGKKDRMYRLDDTVTDSKDNNFPF